MMSTEDILSKLALAHADVELGGACAGTKVESRTYKVYKRAFLFLRPVELMLKLGECLPEAQELANKNPQQYKAGAGGWVTVKLSGFSLPPEKVAEAVDRRELSPDSGHRREEESRQEELEHGEDFGQRKVDLTRGELAARRDLDRLRTLFILPRPAGLRIDDPGVRGSPGVVDLTFLDQFRDPVLWRDDLDAQVYRRDRVGILVIFPEFHRNVRHAVMTACDTARELGKGFVARKGSIDQAQQPALHSTMLSCGHSLLNQHAVHILVMRLV